MILWYEARAGLKVPILKSNECRGCQRTTLHITILGRTMATTNG